MKKQRKNTPRNMWMVAIATMAIFFGNTAGLAQNNTRSQQLALDASDGSRITGFLMHDKSAGKDAPLAILMHGMTGSSVHWLVNDNSTGGDDISRDLVARGYRVVGLDARSHGGRKDEMLPLERVESLHAGKSEPYLAMINGTMNDYDALLEDVQRRFGQPRHILVLGYSMGAQMAVLFAAKHKEVSHIVTLVPPAAKHAPSVSPVNHAHKVNADWLLLTASQDEYSSKADNDALAKAAGGNVDRVEFDSPHRLPRDYVHSVISWVANIKMDNVPVK